MRQFLFFLIAVTPVFSAKIIEVHPEIDRRLDAAEGAYPYQANIVILKSEDEEDNCSGAIIHERWILTAAHCLASFDPDYLLITVGTVRYSGIGGVPCYYDTHVVHKDWNYSPINDVALIRLKDSIKFNDRVQFIKLQKDYSNEYVNVTGILTSWSHQLNYDEPAAILQRKNVTIISQEDCRGELIKLMDKINNSSEDINFFNKALDNVHDLICTVPYKSDRGLCHGDSGGPLVFNGTQIGIVSSSYKCSGHPGLFTRVSSVVNWIQNQLSKYSDKLP